MIYIIEYTMMQYRAFLKFFCCSGVMCSVFFIGCFPSLVLSESSAGLFNRVVQVDDMPIIYVTGFAPFQNYSVNPSEVMVNILHNTSIANHRIVGRVLPVDFIEAPRIIQDDIKSLSPTLIVHLGLEADCRAITLELLSVNIMFEKTADNPLQTLHIIQKNGPFFIQTELQIQEMYEELTQKNIPVSLSVSAGLYVCNTVFYQTLFFLSENQFNIPAGFIHLPLLSDEYQKGMEKDMMIEGIISILLSNIEK